MAGIATAAGIESWLDISSNNDEKPPPEVFQSALLSTLKHHLAANEGWTAAGSVVCVCVCVCVLMGV